MSVELQRGAKWSKLYLIVDEVCTVVGERGKELLSQRPIFARIPARKLQCQVSMVLLVAVPSVACIDFVSLK
jgi:hypothetical protein